MKKEVIVLMIFIAVLIFFVGFKMTGNIITDFKTKIGDVEYGLRLDDGRVIIGDVVNVEYELRLDDGRVIDASTIEFEIGSGQMIKGFDGAIIGMRIGEEKEVTIPPKDAYGESGSGSTHTLAGENLNFKIKVVGIN